ncbi:hypothetical protein M405DRAFT_812161, partial [Rhizopogon salebrosus TDB-379]
MNSAGPGQSGAKGMKRIILMKDRITLASFGFAFVEFIDAQIHPSGFRISDEPVAASFAHQYSFQQVDHMLRDETAIPSSINLGGVEGAFVKYWDDSAMVAVLEFKVEAPPQPRFRPQRDLLRKRRKRRRKPPAPSALPISDKPVTLSCNKGPPGSKPITSLSGPKAPAQISLGFSAETSPLKMMMLRQLLPRKTTKVLSSVLDNYPSSFSAASCLKIVISPPVVAPVVMVSRVPSRAPSPQPVETELEFSDTNALTCLLCARAFKSLDQLKRHNKESDLHKKNFKDANLREIARQKAVAALKASDSKIPEQPRYRDRASERWIMHNQPDVPLPENAGSVVGKKRRHAEGPPPPPSPPPAVNPGQDDANVGNKLLKMMGWKEGSGLGTDGEGRVDPMYARLSLNPVLTEPLLHLAYRQHSSSELKYDAPVM